MSVLPRSVEKRPIRLRLQDLIAWPSICNLLWFHLSNTGWRRLIGCLKLQVIFRKRATNYRALLRQMTYEDKASYDSTPPCTTGWRRLIGSPKLQIIFHKRATKYRALLLKMTCKDKGSYESSPPCSCGPADQRRIRKFCGWDPKIPAVYKLLCMCCYVCVVLYVVLIQDSPHHLFHKGIHVYIYIYIYI